MVKSNSAAGNSGLMNLNGGVMCAIDTETTGLVAGYNDIIEVAIVPLDANIEPMKNILPFVVLIKPKNRFPDSWTQEAQNVHNITREDLAINGIDPGRAGDFFETWVERLALAPGKKIFPLAKNWPFDTGFIQDWLGPKTFRAFFHHFFRDVGPVSHFLNDKAEFEGKQCPFPQTALTDIRSKLKIPPTRSHRALDDAVLAAQVYRRFITDRYFD